MKSPAYQFRFYRDNLEAEGLYTLKVTVKESDLLILSDKELNQSKIEEKLLRYRWEIEEYIEKDRRFLTALKPIAVELNAAKIVKRMAKAAFKAQVGPMAAVAGAVAEFLGQDLLRMGCGEIIVENGGDIFIKTKRIRKVGIYSGKSHSWQGLKLKIHPRQTPCGICTSSGTVGYSLSFGQADAAVILARDAALADAVATATANRVQTKEDLASALRFARSIPGIEGVVIIIQDNLVSWGKVEFTV